MLRGGVVSGRPASGEELVQDAKGRVRSRVAAARVWRRGIRVGSWGAGVADGVRVSYGAWWRLGLSTGCRLLQG
ncbi:hypothetical protein GCM10028799_53980 [Kribbella italica]